METKLHDQGTLEWYSLEDILRQLLVSIINEVFLYPRNILLSKLNLSWFNDNKNWFDRVSVLINLLFKLIIIEACNQ